MDVPLLVSLILLIALSAFFSGSETAYTSLSHVRLERLALTSKAAKAALFLEDHYERLLSTVLIGNNIVNIAASTISALLFISWMGTGEGSLMSTLILTIVILVFGEVTPKNLSKAMPERIAVLFAYPLMFFYWLFFAITVFFEKMIGAIVYVFRLGAKSPTLTEDELKMIVSDIKEEGVINQSEHDLIQKSIVFDDQSVEKIMMPWAKVVKAETNQSDYEIKEMFEINNYSRVPYVDSDTNQLLGFLFQKDFYEMLIEHNSNREALIKEPLFFSRDMKISDAFKRFQRIKQHIAVVIDSKNAGAMLGIVTMEDILEELVGEIEDEYDAEDETERKLYQESGTAPKEKAVRRRPGHAKP